MTGKAGATRASLTNAENALTDSISETKDLVAKLRLRINQTDEENTELDALVALLV